MVLDWKGAADEFRRAAAQRPEDISLRVQCGEAEAEAGAWDRAVIEFTAATEKNPEEIRPWYYLALAQWRGDRAAYRATCGAMKYHFLKSPDPSTVGLLFRTCSLTQDADADMAEFIPLARKFGILHREWARDIGRAPFSTELASIRKPFAV